MSEFKVRHFYLFCISFLLSIFLIFYGLVVNAGMYGWVSLLTSLVLFLFSNVFFRDKFIYIFLVYLYHYVFVFSIFFKEDYLARGGASSDYIPFILLPVFCYITIFPSIFIKKIDLNFLLNNRNVDLFLYILFPFILFSIIYLLPYSFNTFIYGAESIRLGGIENSEYFNLPANSFTTLAVGVSLYYPLYLFFYLQQVANNKNNFLKFVALLGVLSGIIGGLVFAGRDRFVFTFFYMILFYFMWIPYLNDAVKKKVNKFIKYGVLVNLCFLVWITLDRFKSDMFEWFLFYYGAQPYIFAEIYEKNIVHNLSYIFPNLIKGKDLIDTSDSIYWLWGTLFQNIYFSGGLFLCFLFSIYNLFFSSFIFKMFQKIKFMYIIYLMLYFHIVSTGVFYYTLGFPGGNNYIFGMLVFGLFFSFYLKLKV